MLEHLKDCGAKCCPERKSGLKRNPPAPPAGTELQIKKIWAMLAEDRLPRCPGRAAAAHATCETQRDSRRSEWDAHDDWMQWEGSSSLFRSLGTILCAQRDLEDRMSPLARRIQNVRQHYVDLINRAASAIVRQR